MTGNGLTADDTPLGGVTIKLYLDVNRNGTLDASDGNPVATTVSAAGTGAYSFGSVANGTYFVQETVPTGWIRTAPTNCSYYTVCVSGAGTSSNNNDFANYQLDCSPGDVTNVSYLINGTTQVSDLTGNTHQGDIVTVTFTIPAGLTHQVSLVSYTAPASSFSSGTAAQQVVFDADSRTFGPGVHTLTVQIPNSYYQIDFVCGAVIDHFGPAGSNIFYHAEGRYIDSDNGGCQAQIANLSSLSGQVFVDTNSNGIVDNAEQGLAGVTVKLTGTDGLGQAISLTRITGSDGSYSFKGLRNGTYTITESQPSGYATTKNAVGTVNGSAVGHLASATTDAIDQVILQLGKDGLKYNFGELAVTPPTVACGTAASVGFWNGCNGQALIKAFNGSASCTSLGNWLATSFPNLYGSSAGGSNLTNKSNSQVASFFQSLYNVGGQRAEAQVLAAALDVYATTRSLGGNAGSAYGFVVSTAGVGASTFNVGLNGAAFGVANGTTLTVLQLIQATNAQATSGTLYAGNASKKTMAYNVFNAIANVGGIV